MISVTRPRSFVTLWTFAIVAAVAAFVLHLAIRGKTVSLGYQAGRERAEQARLREVKRVLQVEAASYKTPERVEIVARTLLGMEPAPPDRIVPMAGIVEREHAGAQVGGQAGPQAGAQVGAQDRASDKHEGTVAENAEDKGAGPP